MSNVQTYKTLDDMIELARYAHRNQKDKAGLDYFEHPYRVMQTVQAQGGLPYVQMGAILHDVPEDTAFTNAILKALGVPEPALEIVRLLDRHASKEKYYSVGESQKGPEETWPTWAQYVAHHSPDEFYYWEIKGNPGAKMVKLADIGDNTLPWRLSYLPEATQDRLEIKYEKAVLQLTS